MCKFKTILKLISRFILFFYGGVFHECIYVNSVAEEGTGVTGGCESPSGTSVKASHDLMCRATSPAHNVKAFASYKTACTFCRKIMQAKHPPIYRK